MQDELNDLKKEIEELRAEVAAACRDGGSFSVNGGPLISLKNVSSQLEYLMIRVSKLQNQVDALKSAGKK